MSGAQKPDRSTLLNELVTSFMSFSLAPSAPTAAASREVQVKYNDRNRM